MDLEIFWFCLIVVAVGRRTSCSRASTSGSGCCCRSSRATSESARTMFETIGPVWDGNEVWLVVAAGATFAAFPAWYATMFSGFYLALLLVLVLPHRPRRLVRVARQEREPALAIDVGWRELDRQLRRTVPVGHRALASLLHGVPIDSERRLHRRAVVDLFSSTPSSRDRRRARCSPSTARRSSRCGSPVHFASVPSRGGAPARHPRRGRRRGVPRLDGRGRDRPQRQGSVPARSSRPRSASPRSRSPSSFLFAGRQGARSR